MIILEVLYPEYMNLYGDNGNVKFLEKNIPNLKIIYTNLNDKPYFLNNKIDILYMGPCTESQQEEIAVILNNYKKEIKKIIKDGVFILATGNSIEYFGKYIEKANKNKIECLGLYNFYSKRIERLRYNENVIEYFKDIKVVGLFMW